MVSIKLSQDRCPSWMPDCMVVATLEGGRLAAVAARTGGPSVEQAASQELRGKYGVRFSAQQRFVTPANGGATFEVWDKAWALPGLRVQYRVVHEDINHGLLRIESETVAVRREAGEREAARPKL